MKEFKVSQVAQEREVYACMILNLFDELKFLQQYPQRELSITAELFGQIINEQFLDEVVQNIGIKCIFDTLSGKEKMQEFGKIALQQCLKIYNKDYLTHLLENENIKQKYPELY